MSSDSIDLLDRRLTQQCRARISGGEWFDARLMEFEHMIYDGGYRVSVVVPIAACDWTSVFPNLTLELEIDAEVSPLPIPAGGWFVTDLHSYGGSGEVEITASVGALR